MLAYHNDEQIKRDILEQLRTHRKADQLVQGYGYWKGGKGCAVGCTLYSDDHMEYETRFGIPVAIARLEDAIFEGLPVDLARQWPERVMSAVRVGSDLSRVHWKLLHWLLTTPEVNPGIEHPLVRDAVKQCANMMADMSAGKTVDKVAARSAAWAVWSAVWSARSAAAESAAWGKISDRLIALIDAAPMATVEQA